MQIGNVHVVTQGSVGLDDSLQMVLSIPVQDAWLRDSKAGSLKGKTIHIPIRGTVSAPVPDIASVLSNITKQLLGGSVKDVLGGRTQQGKRPARQRSRQTPGRPLQAETKAVGRNPK